jgi:hypothetical protein
MLTPNDNFEFAPLGKDVYALEMAAYEQAYAHYLEAQRLQDEDYLNRDYAEYLNASAIYDDEYTQWLASVELWDQQFANYTVEEGKYYAQEC